MKKKLLLAVIVAATLMSCDKDDDKVNDPGTPQDGQTKFLRKITKTEEGVVTVYNLTYDANKKLMSYVSTDNKETTYFTYDATGNLTKVEETEDEFKNIYNYTYVNNIPVSGTLKSWKRHGGEPDELIEDDKLTYTITNNKVSKIHLEMLLAGNEAIADFAFTYSGNNLSKVVMEGGDFYTANFAFGDKKAVFPKVSNYVLDQAGFSLQFASNNDLRSASFDFPGTTMDESMNMQYTYDNKGYALTSTDGSAQYTYEYQ